MTPARITLIGTLSSYDAALPGCVTDSAPPLGLLTLAAILRPAYSITLIDLDVVWRKSAGSMDEFHERVETAVIASSPEVLGFSTASGSYPKTLRLVESCRRLLPDVPLVLGGPQASVVDV